MKRVLFAGDTHGNTNFWQKVLLPAAERHEVDLIVQAGDFGVWPGRDGKRYLDSLNRLTKVPIWFVRGNHDDTTQLVMRDDNETLIEMRPKVFQIVDGALLDIDGQTLLGIGGAVSIDKYWRTEGETWWADEVTSLDSIDRAVYSDPRRVVDFVVTHDVPDQVDIVSKMYVATGNMLKADPESANNRRKLGILYQKLQPRKPRDHQMVWVHGHYHFAYSTVLNHIRIIGLDCDMSHNRPEGSWTVLEVGKPVEPQAS